MSHAHNFYRCFSNQTEVESSSSRKVVQEAFDHSSGAEVTIYGQRYNGGLELLQVKRNGFPLSNSKQLSN